MPLLEPADELGENRRQRMPAREEIDYFTLRVRKRGEPLALERRVDRACEKDRREGIERGDFLNAEGEELSALAGRRAAQHGDNRKLRRELVDFADKSVVVFRK